MRDALTGKHRSSFAQIGWVEDTVDAKLAAVLAHFVKPLEERIAALEAERKPWYRKMAGLGVQVGVAKLKAKFGRG